MTRAARIAVALAAALAAGPAAGRETDPQRRSLVVQAVERASPAVVNISTEQVVEQRSPFGFPQDPRFDEFFRDFFDPRPRRYTRSSLGSGVIVDTDGTIVTNQHVILRGSRIHVTLGDGQEYDAKLVGGDADSDLAVLRIKASERLPAIAMGASSDLMIGETVIAIGNPFGLSHTVTTGVVSAIGRSLRAEDRTYTDFIQTDASINPGNSGGPLLNINGELIGINTAIYGKAQGIGFAIPVDRVRRNLKELVSYGEVRRGWVGVAVQDLTDALARHFGVRQGVVVTDVDPKSPAAGADLRRGDVITKVDGQPVRSEEDFSERVDSRGIGETIALTLRRDDRDDEVRITAAEFPDDGADDVAWQRLGLAVEADRNGLVVRRVRPGSPCARIGLARGDRLLGIGGTALESTAQFRRRIASLRGARSVLLAVGRGDREYHVNVPLARD